MRKPPLEVLISSALMVFFGLFIICLGALFFREMPNLTQVFTISTVSVVFGLILVMLSAFLWAGYDEARVSAIIIHALILVFSPAPFIYSIPLMWRVGEIRGLFLSLSLTLPTAYSLMMLYLLTRPKVASYMKKVRAHP